MFVCVCVCVFVCVCLPNNSLPLNSISSPAPRISIAAYSAAGAAHFSRIFFLIMVMT